MEQRHYTQCRRDDDEGGIMRVRDAQELGRLVRARRMELGLSQSELAARIGSTRQWLSRFEQATNDVSLTHALAVLHALDLSIEVPSPRASTEADATQRTAAPAPATGAHAVASQPETRSHRFARLRERDDLASVQGSSVLTSQIPLVPPSEVAADTATLRSVREPGSGESHSESGDRARDRGQAHDLWASTSLPRRVSTKPGLRSQWKPGFSVDQEIERIRRSGLFRSDN